MASQLSRKRVVDSPDIPDRLYFKIGDVARICAVEPYVLRFWETQFPQLKPNKSGTGQRLYRRREVELALEIKRLVHGEGYTLSGARQALEVNHRRVESRPAVVPEPGPDSNRPDSNRAARRPDSLSATVVNVRSELREILSLLSNPQPRPPRQRARLLSVSPDSGNLFPL
jgi:DNA-binding transcriptional MerR regulator